ncbi:MAG: hypothetical protein LBH09_07700 [Peptococcaceae bacterium]|jgi:phage protein D|nr:hypothetical protein [Peptococcaceae bacterium]
MTDLMSGSDTYEALAQKYKNFLVPAFKIKAGNTDLADSFGLGVDNLAINLSLDAANSCGFTVVNAYDRKASSFSEKILAQLKLGTILTVEIGYGSQTTMLFKGYISELSYDFQDYPTLTISALDVRRLMMEGDSRMLIHNVKSYSEAFSAVMERYQNICSDFVIDDTDKNLTNVTQHNSDYEFVTKELASKGAREFFVLADKAYFRILQKVEEPLTTLEWGKGLMSFSRNSMYHNASIQVIGFDEKNKDVLIAEVSSKSSDAQVDPIPKPQPSVIHQPDALEIAAVNKRAENEGKKKKQKTQGGSGVCIGLPEVVPGRFIELKKLDKSIDNKYYITNVSHSLGSDGYTTRFNIGGWK